MLPILQRCFRSVGGAGGTMFVRVIRDFVGSLRAICQIRSSHGAGQIMETKMFGNRNKIANWNVSTQQCGECWMWQRENVSFVVDYNIYVFLEFGYFGLFRVFWENFRAEHSIAAGIRILSAEWSAVRAGEGITSSNKWSKSETTSYPHTSISKYRHRHTIASPRMERITCRIQAYERAQNKRAKLMEIDT